MTPANNPLAALRDVHLPPAISWWPPANGWYVLAAILSLLLIIGFVWWIRRFIKRRPARHALRILKRIISDRDLVSTRETVARLSVLQRRIALAYYPRKQVAALEGAAWLKFLANSSEQNDYISKGASLAIAPYQAKPEVDIDELSKLIKNWIKHHV